MTKAALLIEMMDLLRSRPGITIGELATALDRSERTLYRWLNELSVDLHTPIYCNEGGYFLSSRQVTANLKLTPEEILAVRLSLKSAPFTQGSPISRHAESAWLKIRDASAWEQLQTAGEISDSYAVSITVPEGAARADVTEMLRRAIAGHHRLNIVYRSQKSNRIKDYTIEPYAVVFRRHSWYVVAFCLQHGKVIQFKLVRIRTIIDTGIRFEPPGDFSVDDYYSLSWEAWAGGEPTKVKIRFSADVAAMVSESKRHPTQVIHSEPNGGVIFEAVVAGIEEIAIWLMGFGRDAVVLEPSHLRDYMLERASGIVRQYRGLEKNANTSDKLTRTDSASG